MVYSFCALETRAEKPRRVFNAQNQKSRNPEVSPLATFLLPLRGAVSDLISLIVHVAEGD
jgi:hypothetical protein